MNQAPLSNAGLPWWPSGKESACGVEDVGSVPGRGRYPAGGNGNSLQFSYLCRLSPWTEEPGRLQSMGMKRAGHNLATEYACKD